MVERVTNAVLECWRTYGIMEDGKTLVGTEQMGDMVVEQIGEMVEERKELQI